MPSTYDSILRLELQAVGENSSTWGTRTNNNLELIAQAIDGHVSVNIAGSGDYALTVAQASTDESRYNFITFSGLLTGARNIIVPQSPKAYIIRDNTTGNYPVVVKTSIGTGVSTYQGSVIGIACDSVSVFPASEVNRVNRAGDSMTGTLSLPSGTSVSASQAMRSDEITARINTAVTSALPAGCILLWSGSVSTIPSGWALCDGTGGTPNLVDRFVVGAGSTYAVGATGGATSVTTSSNGAHTHTGNTGSHTLDVTELPAHTHTASVTDPGHTHTVTPQAITQTGTTYGFYPGGIASFTSLSAASTTTGISVSNSSTGGGAGHTHTISSDGAHTHTVATLPPYYALAYIMKL